MTTNKENSLDLTSDPININEQYNPKEKPYNPQKQEDNARRCIAYILLGILGIILLWTLITISFRPDCEETVIKVLQIILGPIIALVSAATGFYFGAKSK